MRSRIQTFSAIAIVVFGSFATHASEFIRVDMEILNNGKRLATPSFLTEENVPAKFKLSGTDAYELEFTVESHAADQLKFSMNFQSATHGSAQPTLIMLNGETASFRLGKLEIKMSAAKSKT
jgi:hypothetical protein